MKVSASNIKVLSRYSTWKLNLRLCSEVAEASIRTATYISVRILFNSSRCHRTLVTWQLSFKAVI